MQTFRLSSIFDIYIHKYVYFNVIVLNRLDHLTLFKHHLNGLNAKQNVIVYRLAFRITLVTIRTIRIELNSEVTEVVG